MFYALHIHNLTHQTWKGQLNHLYFQDTILSYFFIKGRLFKAFPNLNETDEMVSTHLSSYTL